MGRWWRGNEKTIKGEKGMKVRKDEAVSHSPMLAVHALLDTVPKQISAMKILHTLAIIQQVLLTMPYIGALCRQYVLKNLQCTLPSYLC